ncbi:putative translation initiation factor eIF-2B alpha subunit [Parasynechococcus marenigrum WH 8102]|nr:putative translation initiation factor eIF-2B alpha subunit [Parasynechococcus marenigrum WH 8102]
MQRPSSKGCTSSIFYTGNSSCTPLTLPPSLRWTGDHLELLDQRRLPEEVSFLKLHQWRDVAEAIATMAVRGAPAIGVAAAWGVVLAAQANEDLDLAVSVLKSSRPTAVNLGWALDRIKASPAAQEPVDPQGLAAVAAALEADDRARTQTLVDHGVGLLASGSRVLHHCHTGAIATAGVGTALGVIAAGHARGVVRHAWLDETRPRLQGAALSAWELGCLGVPCTVIVDGASGLLMRRQEVDAVLVGCDRVAANGDVANKVGTYNLALVARAHGIPFYVCAPGSSMDRSTSDGDAITIEERPQEEITQHRGQRLAAPGAAAWNPAFDITPAHLVTALITEFGVIRPPYRDALQALPLDRQP